MSRKYQNNFENYLIVQRVARKTKKAYLQAVHGLDSCDTLKLISF